MKIVLDIIAEVFMFRFISESFFDENNFPLDKNREGNVWRINSTTDHLTCLNIFYHPSVVAENKEEIRLCCEVKH